MQAVDFFYYSLGIGFLIIVAATVAVAAETYLTFKNIRRISAEISGTVEDIAAVKDLIKTGVLNIIKGLVEKYGPEEKKGGGKRGK